MLPQATDAEDATQEVLLRVHERAGQFSGRSRFSTWLHRLTVNHCLHLIERAGRRATAPLSKAEECVDGGLSPLDSALATETRERLSRLLQRVPADQRAVLVLRELEALTYAEIAEVLEIPVGTVMSRLSRARERLAALARCSTSGDAGPSPPTRVSGLPSTIQ